MRASRRVLQHRFTSFSRIAGSIIRGLWSRLEEQEQRLRHECEQLERRRLLSFEWATASGGAELVGPVQDPSAGADTSTVSDAGTVTANSFAYPYYTYAYTPPDATPVPDTQVVRTNLNAAGGNPAPAGISASGVRYFDGQPKLDFVDLESDGFGRPWGQTRSWDDPAAGAGGQFVNGNRWAVEQMPQLIENTSGSTNTLIALASGTDQRWFDISGSTYVPRGYDQETLVHGTGTYTLTDTTGAKLTFYDFTVTPAAQRGQFQGYADPYGNTITTLYAGASDPDGVPQGRLKTVTRNSAATGASETWQYRYTGSRISLVQLVRGSTVVRQAAYVYYGSTGFQGGNSGDLEYVKIEDGAGNVLDTTYYRYWMPYLGGDPANGYIGGIKYIFTDASYARLLASLTNPANVDAASDTQLKPYADRYFEWNSTNHKVTKEVVQGDGSSASSSPGLGTYTYGYSTSGFANAYGNWKYKTTETLPDGNTNTVYLNYAGEVILSVLTDKSTGQPTSGFQWGTFYTYDPAGRIAMTAQPSAVINLPNPLSGLDANADVLHATSGNYQYLSDNTGLISTNVYYGAPTTATSNTAGGVAGYLNETRIRQGETTADIKQETLQYFAQTVGGSSVYPLATDTVYRNTDGSFPQATSYTPVYYPGTFQLQSLTTTLPLITTAQNGPGDTADTSIAWFDTLGRQIWSQDADHYVNYTGYIDPASGADGGTGAVVKTVTDVDYAKLTAAEKLLFPAGWPQNNGEQHLITTTAVDGLGRPTSLKVYEKDGATVHSDTETVYLDTNKEVRVYPGWSGSGTTGSTTGPIQISREYRPAPNSSQVVYNETLTSSATPTTVNGLPTGAETLLTANITSLSRDITNKAGQVIETDDYFSLAGATYVTTTPQITGAVASNDSSAGNFSKTIYAYDLRGRQNAVTAPTGTITRTVFDALSRTVSKWTGTNDAGATDFNPAGTGSPNNMFDLEDDQYDGNSAGDSNLTKATAHPGGGAAERTTLFLYDFRDRQAGEKDGAGTTTAAENGTNVHRPITYSLMDNLGNVTATYQYDGDAVDLNDFAPAANAGSAPNTDGLKLRALSKTDYDEQDRPYRDYTYSVDQTNGTPSASALTTNTFYDHRGNIIEVSPPGGLVEKHQYDGAGRDIKDSWSDGGVLYNPGGALSWINAKNEQNDVVLRQVIDTYDAAGNVIQTLDRERFDNDPTTGPSSVGDLQGPQGGSLASRDSFTAAYFDRADRPTDSVDVGTAGSPPGGWTRPATVPARSDQTHVTHTDYDVMGNPYQVIDPKGIKMVDSFDLLGRMTQQIEASDGGSPSDAGDRTTAYTYDADGHTLTQTATVPGNVNQQTKYVYTVAGGASALNSFDLLSKTEFPNKTTGVPDDTPADDQTYAYNAAGQQTQSTDRNGTTHTYTIDVLGRTTLDAVTAYTAGAIDTSVLSLGYSFDTGGRPYQQTSYNDAAGPTSANYPNNIVNQVEDDYNGLGQLTDDWQSHSGTVAKTGASPTPETKYTYTEMSNGQNNSRVLTLFNSRYSTINDVYGAQVPISSITFTYNSTTEQVTATATTAAPMPAGLTTNALVTVSGAAPADFDGTFHPTNVASNSFSYVLFNTYPTPPAAPTGPSILATFEPTQSLDSAISRVTALTGYTSGFRSAGLLEGYGYLGIGSIVQANRGNGVQLSAATSTGALTPVAPGGDRYAGIDAFGNVVDRDWLTPLGNSLVSVDRLQYDYDRNSNLLFKNDVSAPSVSEIYHQSGAGNGYDNLGRIKAFSRGTLDGTHTTITSPTRTQTFSLDAEGNRKTLSTAVNGGTPQQQTRTFNGQNQIATISGSSEPNGPAPTLPSYDNAGDITTDDSGNTFASDAWGRQVKVKDGSGNQLNSYVFDAIGRRILRRGDSVGATGWIQADGTGPADLYYDGQRLLVDQQTSVSTLNFWGLAGSSELITRDQSLSVSNDELTGEPSAEFGAANRSPDTGTPGKVVTTAQGANAYGESTCVAGDDIYVAGYQFNPATNSNDFAIWAYHGDGSPDTNFRYPATSPPGESLIDFGAGSDDRAFAIGAVTFSLLSVAGQSAGNAACAYVDAGTGQPAQNAFSNPTNPSEYGPYNPSSTAIFTNLGSPSAFTAVDAGTMVFAGYAGTKVAVVELIGMGLHGELVLDPFFNQNGAVPGAITTAVVGASTSGARSISYESIVSGFSRTYRLIVGGWADGSGVLLAYHYNDQSLGTLDTTFGTGGIVQTQLSSSSSYGGRVITANDGSLMFGGGTTVGGHQAIALAHYDTNGNLDNAFGNAGKTVVSIASGDASLGALVDDVIYYPSGLVEDRFLAAGTFNGHFLLTRITAGGKLDYPFGNDGLVETGFSGTDTAAAITEDSLGAFIVVGSTVSPVTHLSAVAMSKYANTAQRVWFEQDPNGNVTSVSDDSGNILERYAYDPFGQVTALNPDGTQEADPGLLSVQFQPGYLFQGLREDAATNTIASATRVYSPSLGTWMQPDPAGYVDGSNLYQFTDSNPESLTDPSGLKAGRAQDPLAPLPGVRSYSQVWQEAKDEVQTLYGLGPSTPWDQVVSHHALWFDTTYGSLVTSIESKKEDWYRKNEFWVESDAQYAKDLSDYNQPPTIRAYNPTPGQKVLDDQISYAMEHPEAPPEGMEAAQLLRQNNGSLAGALFDAARSRAPDIAAALGGIAMRGSGGRSAMGRTAAAAQEGGGPLYEVGTYNQLRGTPVPETTVHHVLSRLRGQELIADFATDRMAGTEFAIRLPASEADAVDAAVFRRAEISSGARQELAWQIRDLRNFSNAPNSALEELIDRNRVRRPWDFNLRGNR